MFTFDASSWSVQIFSFVVELLIVGLAFFFVERIRPAHKRAGFFKAGFREELGLALLNVSLFSPFSYAVIAGVFLATLSAYLPYQVFAVYLGALPLTLQIVAACFIKDFSTYWRHRFTHRFALLWPFHSVHHAAQEITWLTSLRLHPVDIFVAIIFDVFILHVLGFDSVGIIVSVFITKGFNYFTHANIDLQFDRPLRYILASPNFHRWHHAAQRDAYDKNFCAMFSCLDVMFGTYYHPEHPPKAYGLEKPEQKRYPKSLAGWLVYPFKMAFRL